MVAVVVAVREGRQPPLRWCFDTADGQATFSARTWRVLPRRRRQPVPHLTQRKRRRQRRRQRAHHHRLRILIHQEVKVTAG